jgi:hypothetical protein
MKKYGMQSHIQVHRFILKLSFRYAVEFRFEGIDLQKFEVDRFADLIEVVCLQQLICFEDWFFSKFDLLFADLRI